ncbi:Rha family transcriptional regulator [Vampirovibrio sp.]|uniref:Rha family transcriptional regulator n=1 Tax=Vampirovibrio sp. TaxID=2717857 RepID=UPI00359381AB
MAYTSRPINPEVRIIDGGPVTNTQNMAWVFRIQHEELLEDIRHLECSLTFRNTNFTEVSYTDPEGELQTMFRVTRDGFILLARKFTDEKSAQIHHDYLEAFDRLDENLKQLQVCDKNPFLTMSTLDLMKMQASIEAERRILRRANY